MSSSLWGSIWERRPRAGSGQQKPLGIQWQLRPALELDVTNVLSVGAWVATDTVHPSISLKRGSCQGLWVSCLARGPHGSLTASGRNGRSAVGSLLGSPGPRLTCRPCKSGTGSFCDQTRLSSAGAGAPCRGSEPQVRESARCLSPSPSLWAPGPAPCPNVLALSLVIISGPYRRMALAYNFQCFPTSRAVHLPQRLCAANEPAFSHSFHKHSVTGAVRPRLV